MFDDHMTEEDPSKANAEIDANLRRAYDEITQQDIPDRFKQLLADLRAGNDSVVSNDNEGPAGRKTSEDADGEK
ncbi:MAG: NepR family anti-sigma factor [Pseudomonadota bacterium]